MINAEYQASRKGLKGDRIAVCPKLGCKTLERLKSLKFGIFGLNKYPKCKEHKVPLVFLDEIIGNFLNSVNACLFDNSIKPPKDLLDLVKNEHSENVISFYNSWMYCSSIARGAKIVPSYLDSLSRAYLNSLNKRQKKTIYNEEYKKKKDKLIFLGFKKIEMEYIEFLRNFYKMNESLYDKKEIKTLPQQIREIISEWFNKLILSINHYNLNAEQDILSRKKYCDKILQARNCMLMLGQSPSEFSINISTYELFLEYRIFLDEGLCSRITPNRPNLMIQKEDRYLEELNRIAVSKGGICLSKEYINNGTKLDFRCHDGHIWQATPNSIKDGTWCPECYLNKEGYLAQIKEIALKKGGSCLSDEYVNSHTRLRFRCQLGHEWMSAPYLIKNGHWCPKCSQGMSERICRKFFEEIFRVRFPKTKFEWLLNSKGNLMHLDGFSTELSLGFEYSGSQHYKYKENWFGTWEDFKRRQIDDKIKRDLCKVHGIILIEIPYTIKFDKLEDFIIRSARRNGIHCELREKKIDWRKFKVYPPNKLSSLQRIVQEKGGNLLSNYYFNNRTKLDFQCADGHTWKARPYSIISGDWCPKCYQQSIKNLSTLKAQELKKIIENKKGKLLSEYTNRRTKIKIQCINGHSWEALPFTIISGSWCPKCHHNKEYYLHEIKEIAIFKGGECLTNEYKNNKTKMNFKCAKGHDWWATPKSIKEGTWCPHCYKKYGISDPN